LAGAFLAVMVRTGGRGQTAAFMIGAWVYLLPYGRSKRAWTGIILGLLSIIAVVYLSASNPQVLERWHKSYEGNLSGRQIIYPTAIDMILERPIFGWHPTIWDYELGRRIGLLSGKDAHNFVLSILLEVGVVGASPFFVGVWLCGRLAWRARRGSLGVLPLALMVTALTSSMSVTDFILSSSKLHWLVMALTVAAAASAPSKLGEQYSIRLASQPIKGARKAS
jgi:O-antigen ligase